MPHSLAMRNKAVDGVCLNGGASYFGLHTADPGTTGAAELTGGGYARVQGVPPAAASGSTTFPLVEITVPGGGTLPTWWARYTAASGGAPYDSGLLPNGGPGVYNSPGTYKATLTTAQPA